MLSLLALQRNTDQQVDHLVQMKQPATHDRLRGCCQEIDGVFAGDIEKRPSDLASRVAMRKLGIDGKCLVLRT